MSSTDDDFKLQIAEHMGQTTEQLKNLAGAVNGFKDEQKQSREHNDIAVKELQVHFDSKIAGCHEDVMNTLEKEHLTSSGVRNEITKAIKASEMRNRKYVGWFMLACGTIAGFIYKYIDEIERFIDFIKGNPS